MADYCTLDELKEAITVETSGHDSPLLGAITAASRAIDSYCNRPDGFVALATATARRFSGSGGAVQWVDECVEVTDVEVKDSATDTAYTAWAASDWLAASGNPENPDFHRTPYRMLIVDPTGDYDHFTGGRFAWRAGFRPDPNSVRQRGTPTVRVTAKWGYAVSVPAQVKEACIIQTARWYKRGQSAWADTVANPDVGQLMYRKELDPDVKFILSDGGFVKPRLGA